MKSKIEYIIEFSFTSDEQRRLIDNVIVSLLRKVRSLGWATVVKANTRKTNDDSPPNDPMPLVWR